MSSTAGRTLNPDLGALHAVILAGKLAEMILAFRDLYDCGSTEAQISHDAALKRLEFALDGVGEYGALLRDN